MAVDERETQGGVRTASPLPVQRENELSLVKRYVLLGIVTRILDHDIRIIGGSGIKFPRFYETFLRGVQDRVLLDLVHLRGQFRKLGIKVYEEKQETDGMRASYVCRGYHHQFLTVWGGIKEEAEQTLKSYLSR
ncbi:hypothetical protein ACFQZE_01285 [Paenibacillus sp. GCM10027627]|uniref:hypothetical protein n=1 Tax=unclassified Paenibacillus TaxID=185978 RepID=UPI00362A9302